MNIITGEPATHYPAPAGAFAVEEVIYRPGHCGGETVVKICSIRHKKRALRL
jgi:hypothetical protein